MAALAEQLKNQGNDAFRRGDYPEAESFYTQAIQKYSRNPLIFTNRANVRLKLSSFEGAVNDCLKSLELTGPDAHNHKAYYFLAQAQLALNHPREALSSAQTAYQQVLHPAPTAKISPNDLQTFSLFVLKCKKARFTARERDRLLRQGDLRAELEDGLSAALARDLAALSQLPEPLGPVELRERTEDLHAQHALRLEGLKAVFAIAEAPGSSNQHRREVPDYLIDMITFEPMHDPVVTKNGHSYERATLYEHLKRSATDPLTREPLTMAEVRSNLGLRAACEEFWASGAGEWIGDW